MDKFKLRMKTPTGLGIEYVTVFATSNFERYLNKHNLKYARDITKDYQLTDRFEKLQNNWNELKKWLEETIKQYDNVGLKFKKESNFECASRSYDYLKQYQTMLDKMQKLQGDDKN